MASNPRKRAVEEAAGDYGAAGKSGPVIDFSKLVKHAPKFFLFGSLLIVIVVMSVSESPISYH